MNHPLSPLSTGDAILRGIAGLVVCVAAAGLMACGGPYVDLAAAFPGKGPPGGTELKVRRVVLISTRHRGAYNYTGVLKVTVADRAIEIRPRAPQSLFLADLTLPASGVSGCSMTCFGTDDQRADLVFADQGAEVSFDAAAEVVEWCWRNGLPMLSGKQEREWLYEGHALPSKRASVRVARDEYARQARSTCMGY